MQTDALLHSFRYSINFLGEAVSDLTDEQMVLQTEGMNNHAAWTIGHITFSCQCLCRELGVDPWLKESWGKRFGMGSQPTGNMSDYGSRADLWAILEKSSARTQSAVKALTDEQLLQPLPNEAYHDDLPTVAHAINQILVSHTAYHVGQLVTWRRLVGLPKIERPFL